MDIKTESKMKDIMTISGQEIEVSDCWLNQIDLSFYPENPRIYSIVYCGDDKPSQSEIEERLIVKDHVKQLYQSIKANGGLIDPLIVVDGKNIVIEGNSRLAAYRILASDDPIKWGKVRCRILPENIDEKLIFNLLGQYHIIGRKDWAPFEQAGYLWRRKNHHGASVKEMAGEMGISEGIVRSLIKVYSFMHENNDVDVQHWSYYDELLKIPAKKKASFPQFDNILVQKIKSGEISKAVEIRDKVKKIVAVPGKSGEKLVRKFLENKNSIERCYEGAIARGATNEVYKKLHSFREYILDTDIENLIFEMKEDQLKKCLFEIKKIFQAAGRFLNKKKF